MLTRMPVALEKRSKRAMVAKRESVCKQKSEALPWLWA